ncbi:Fe/S biogenesis protein NfuA [Pontiella desulfatans]|uniref:Fe/S biogenesis protein NfuA n=1 Tax=Pontiella desulfatans TaxID=2750659 RepID=A0A6C2TXB3_PONDE|nr:NifU family protein [Pontiella desulfatans]VGO12243.1 Fe/S biogenesis protein NfuA [Pontiella desulfatans]
MTDQEIMDAVNVIMAEEVAPALASHGGGALVTKVENGVVFVELEGGCKGCPGARMTMKNGIETLLKERVPEVKEVIDDTVHM